jgi:hypothetical protein
MLKQLLLVFFLIIVCFSATAQGLSKEYLGSAKLFFTSQSFQEWIHIQRFGESKHPAIIRKPIRGYYSSGSASLVRYYRDLFGRKGSGIIYQWVKKINQDSGDAFFVKVDSIVLSESEKKEIAIKMIMPEAKDFEWANDFFPDATFPVNSADSLFNHGKSIPGGLYHISLPVFLRNYSICIYNYACIRAGGGHTAFVVYKKNNNGHWWHYGEFDGGDF